MKMLMVSLWVAVWEVSVLNNLREHPDITEVEVRLLWFQLKLDMVARCLAKYPVGTLDDFKPFQVELQTYVAETKEEKVS